LGWSRNDLALRGEDRPPTKILTTALTISSLPQTLENFGRYPRLQIDPRVATWLGLHEGKRRPAVFGGLSSLALSLTSRFCEGRPPG
jgi:hypothetical protein